MMQNIPFPRLIEQTHESIAARARQVRNVQPIRLSRQVIQERREEIAEHKWYLSERLGRDVGNDTAAIDYLENIARIRTVGQKQLSGSGRHFLSWLAEWVEVALGSEGAANLATTQCAIHGVSPQAWPVPQSAASKSNGNHVQAIAISADRIAQHAEEIQEHKWYLSERLGRDVGARVAAADYVNNVCAPAAVSWRDWIAMRLEALMEASGPNSVANLERVMPRPGHSSRF